MSATVDPITRSVVHHRLSSIVAEMGEAMLRTSYSQILNSSRDFSIGICDTRSRLIAQADHIPVHVGALPWATRAIEARFKDIVPGDVFLLNDPYHGGSHLPDLTAFVPVFAEGRRMLWTIVRAHQSDIGGATHGGYNPQATEIWQEGLRVPPVRLYEAGKLRDDLLDMLALNVRNGRDFRGDLAAMVGAANLGRRRLDRLFAEFGRGMVEAAMEGILDAFTRPLARLDAEVGDALGDLAVRIAGALLGRSYAADPALLEALVREALDLVGNDQRQVELRLHPDDLAMLGPQLLALDGVRLSPDANLARGDLRLHADSVRIDGNLSSRLNAALQKIASGGER